MITSFAACAINARLNSYAGRETAAGAIIPGASITVHAMPRPPAGPPRADDVIRSRSNLLVQRLRTLKEKGRRAGTGLTLLEGGKLVEEALGADVALLEAAASSRFGRR